jgi:hypothetical protein
VKCTTVVIARNTDIAVHLWLEAQRMPAGGSSLSTPAEAGAQRKTSVSRRWLVSSQWVSALVIICGLATGCTRYGFDGRDLGPPDAPLDVERAQDVSSDQRSRDIFDLAPGTFCHELGPCSWSISNIDVALLPPSCGTIGPGSITISTTRCELRLAELTCRGQVQRLETGDVCVFFVDELLVDQDDVASAGGSRPLVIVARGKVEVLGTIDGAGHGESPGPGGGMPPVSNQPRPGGGPGRGGICGCIDDEYDDCGGGGGGFGSPGGAGGLETDPSGSGCSTVPPGGVVYGLPNLVPLLGGSGGGSGGEVAQNEAVPGNGGGGGGAPQISSFLSITIAGVINVSGGGGQGGRSTSHSTGGGAGGSGGSLLLEAPTISGSGWVVANGGGGGAAGWRGAGGDGENGGSNDRSAAGGTAATPASGNGGAGAAGVTPAQPGGDGNAGGGGGGGGLGRLHLRWQEGRVGPSLKSSGALTSTTFI